MTEAVFAKMQGAMWAATVTKGDAVHFPAGFILVEKIHSSQHCCFKIGSAAMSLQMAGDMQALSASEESCMMMHAWMMGALDAKEDTTKE
eukprot:6470329-Amphidinium_carterae.1